MKMLQLLRDVLFSLLALIMLMALMPMPASAHAVYPAQPGAHRFQVPLPVPPKSLTDTARQTWLTSVLTAGDGDHYLAQMTSEDLAAMYSKTAAIQANQQAASNCRSVASPVHCDSPAHSSSLPRPETSYLPEPSPWFMLILGLVGIALLRRDP
ncbi:PEP-CTERM sorting domain-containing protein [Undibacterium sp.]|jgi:hypothetical protein|uniref:PEP-CTERM sorting domain-containing protein n=1 Tax=Undibacterium sp. TaxID=1914977 RepID=UPI002C76C34A|nr:PEP-CTERM sorting domain-containing protein [Undibacterium sp.]HTD03872.1 PEP-CTERM sorting domain-containing protein [Undibacterium sp.]